MPGLIVTAGRDFGVDFGVINSGFQVDRVGAVSSFSACRFGTLSYWADDGTPNSCPQAFRYRSDVLDVPGQTLTRPLSFNSTASVTVDEAYRFVLIKSLQVWLTTNQYYKGLSSPPQGAQLNSDSGISITHVVELDTVNNLLALNAGSFSSIPNYASFNQYNPIFIKGLSRNNPDNDDQYTNSTALSLNNTLYNPYIFDLELNLTNGGSTRSIHNTPQAVYYGFAGGDSGSDNVRNVKRVYNSNSNLLVTPNSALMVSYDQPLVLSIGNENVELTSQNYCHPIFYYSGYYASSLEDLIPWFSL